MFSSAMRMAAGGALLGLLTLAGFSAGWLRGYRKRTGVKAGGGRRLNALGFGILPALTVGKAFEQYTSEGRGTLIAEPLPAWPLLTGDGRYLPCRIEMLLALAAFAALCIWLALRENDFPDNGDLAGVSLCCWAGIRNVTECFRETTALAIGEIRLVPVLCGGVTLILMIVWTRRRMQRVRCTGQTVLNWTVLLAAAAAVILNRMGKLETGSGIGDLLLIAGCSAAAAVVTLETGGGGRRT